MTEEVAMSQPRGFEARSFSVRDDAGQATGRTTSGAADERAQVARTLAQVRQIVATKRVALEKDRESRGGRPSGRIWLGDARPPASVDVHST